MHGSASSVTIVENVRPPAIARAIGEYGGPSPRSLRRRRSQAAPCRGSRSPSSSASDAVALSRPRPALRCADGPSWRSWLMCTIMTMPLFTTTPIRISTPIKAMIENVVPVSQNSQNTPKTEKMNVVRIAAGIDQRLEHRAHDDVDQHERDQRVEQHLLAGVVVAIEALAETPAIAGRQRECRSSPCLISSRASGIVLPSARFAVILSAVMRSTRWIAVGVSRASRAHQRQQRDLRAVGRAQLEVAQVRPGSACRRPGSAATPAAGGRPRGNP